MKADTHDPALLHELGVIFAHAAVDRMLVEQEPKRWAFRKTLVTRPGRKPFYIIDFVEAA